MNPTVMAAAIGVGGTVLVGVAGFSAAIWNTRRTIAHARESRVWDKRAAAYEAALAELVNRGARRERELDQMRSDVEPANFLAETSAARDTPAWSAAQVQLLAYASREVLDALNEARSVDFEESSRFDKVQEAMKAAAASGADDQAFPERVIPVIKQAISALDKGHKCDMALIDLMRTELRSPR